jgi:hypothetical protein
MLSSDSSGIRSSKLSTEVCTSWLLKALESAMFYYYNKGSFVLTFYLATFLRGLEGIKTLKGSLGSFMRN